MASGFGRGSTIPVVVVVCVCVCSCVCGPGSSTDSLPFCSVRISRRIGVPYDQRIKDELKSMGVW